MPKNVSSALMWGPGRTIANKPKLCAKFRKRTASSRGSRAPKSKLPSLCSCTPQGRYTSTMSMPMLCSAVSEASHSRGSSRQ